MAAPKRPLVLLVIECQPRINWYDIFADCKVHGVREVQVEQATWQEISVTNFDSKCLVELKAAARPHPGTSQERNRVVTPDFILMRSVTRSVGHLDDRNKLFALKHANIPSLNSLHSCYMVLERAWVFAELKKIQERLGKDVFPLIPQSFYPSYKQMVIPPAMPCVIKIGPYHSGFGKMLVKDDTAWDDLKSVIACHNDYATSEPFIAYDWDIRIQKIGPYYRAFRRMSPNWKGNVGHGSVNEDIEVTPRYKLWVDECAKLFGGLDICAVDALHSKEDGKEWILELNDTAIGLANRHEQEDYGHMRALVLSRMEQEYPLSPAAAFTAPEMKSEGSDATTEGQNVSWHDAATPGAEAAAVSIEMESKTALKDGADTSKEELDKLRVSLMDETTRRLKAEAELKRLREAAAKSNAAGGSACCVVQ